MNNDRKLCNDGKLWWGLDMGQTTDNTVLTTQANTIVGDVISGISGGWEIKSNLDTSAGIYAPWNSGPWENSPYSNPYPPIFDNTKTGGSNPNDNILEDYVNKSLENVVWKLKYNYQPIYKLKYRY